MSQTQQEIEVPDPIYQPTFSLIEQFQRDADRVEAKAVAPTQETILDNGWDRWRMMVLPGEPDRLTLQLLVAEHITWWKKIEVKASFFGNFFVIRTLGTQDDNKNAAVDLRVTDVPGSGALHLDFWKAGFLNFGQYLFSQVLPLPNFIGNRVVCLCDRDNPSQP